MSDRDHRSAPADSRSAEPGRGAGVPVLTALTVGATGVVTYLSHRDGSGLRGHLDRSASALHDGEWWRVVSPVLVQTDPELWQVLGTLALAAAVGVVSTRGLPPVDADEH